MRGCGLPERIGEPTQARLPELEHLDQVIVNAVQRSRRTDRARLVGELTLLCGQAPDPRLESGLLDAPPREPAPPLGRRGRRWLSAASSVSGSSKKSKSMSASRSLIGRNRGEVPAEAAVTLTRNPAGKGVSRPPANPFRAVSNAASAVLQSELVLGRYRPLKPLGSGGSGSVWLSRDETTGLDVALKIVPREGKAGSRAEREAEAAARLRHPSCQRAYGFGRDSRHVYIAYEYTPGRTFREALRAGDLDDATAIESAVQMLEGLAHAHARGIVHRDVKPSNVLLADGDRVSVRLLDFGLARLPQAETLTAAGDVPGTLAYISPERLGGEPATPAADVWAVGVLLWEALAGRHPFWQSSLLETARAIEAGAQPLASMRPDLPRPLLAAVDRALDLDPARRPDAAVLAQT